MRKALFVASVLVAVYCSLSVAGSRKILVKDGDLWIEGQNLTKTGGKIDRFMVSPSGRYASAHKIIGYIEEHDDSLQEGQKPNMIPAYSVVIVDLVKRQALNDITAPEELLHPGEWRQGDIYRFYTGSQLDVIGTYEYDPKANKVRKLEFDNKTGKYK